MTQSVFLYICMCFNESFATLSLTCTRISIPIILKPIWQFAHYFLKLTHAFICICISTYKQIYFQCSVFREFQDFWNFCVCEFPDFLKYGSPDILIFPYFCNCRHFRNTKFRKFRNSAILWNGSLLCAFIFGQICSSPMDPFFHLPF